MNRHNAGFWFVDALTNNLSLTFSLDKKFQSELCRYRNGEIDCWICKPQTYMNESGRAVQLAMKFYKLTSDQLYVFHDELDLQAGKMRVKQGGGHAGHNGLRSIAACIGSPDFWRVRLGIGHPGHKDRVHSYVLSDFSKAEMSEWCENFIDISARHSELLLFGREEDYMTRVAQFAPVPSATKA